MLVYPPDVRTWRALKRPWHFLRSWRWDKKRAKLAKCDRLERSYKGSETGSELVDEYQVELTAGAELDLEEPVLSALERAREKRDFRSLLERRLLR